MPHRSVLLELLAVIARQHHPGALGAARAHEPLEQPSNLIVHEADLAVVAIDQEPAVVVGEGPLGLLELGDRVVGRVPRAGVSVREDGAVGGGRVVRPVRIEVVHEEEERLRSLPWQPAERRVGDPVGGRLEPRLQPVSRSRQTEVLERPEPALEAERPVDINVRHEGAGHVAGALQHLRQGRDLRREPQAVVLDAVARRVASRLDRHHRGQGPGRGRPGALEDGRPGCQPVDRRRGRTRVAVGPEMIGAQRVDHDEQDVRVARVIAPRGAARQQERQGEERQREARAREDEGERPPV